MLGKSPKVTDKTITRIINNQLDIKLGPFTQELDVVQRKIKNRKAAGLETPLEIWKTRKSNDLQLRYCNAVYNQNTIEMNKRLHLPLPKKGQLRTAKYSLGITLTSIVTMIYNALLLGFIVALSSGAAEG